MPIISVVTARLTGGSPRVGVDHALRDARWVDQAELPGLDFYPPLADALVQCLEEDCQGEMRFLGNVWKEVS